MTERTDHVGEAHACEEAGLAVMREMGADLPPHMEAVMQFDIARLHAQLAFAEQQRIANLIAYAQLLESQYAEAAKHPEEFDHASRAASVERHGVALGWIREGLGL